MGGTEFPFNEIQTTATLFFAYDIKTIHVQLCENWGNKMTDLGAREVRKFVVCGGSTRKLKLTRE
jgi:hypothetical protein